MWGVACPARSVEPIRDERGLGATIINVSHRDYMKVYLDGVIDTGDPREAEAASKCFDQYNASKYKAEAKMGLSVLFEECMNKNYPH